MTRGTRLATVAAACVALSISCPVHAAADARDRFFDVPMVNSVETFDLKSVAMLGTHRFTIVGVTIDKPDVLRLRLAVLGVLKDYCKRPAGKYRAPNDLLAMGPPNMPIHEIAVQLHERTSNGITQHWKTVWWDYPYSKLAEQTAKGTEEDPTVFMCGDSDVETTAEYLRERNDLTNGVKMTEMFDCANGLWGLIASNLTNNNFTMPVPFGSNAYFAYMDVCYRVLNETPYLPPEPSQ